MYDQTKPKLAVIGSGISGLGAAWLLQDHFAVDLYEAAPRFGGHTNTVRVSTDEGEFAIDTGFIVYNEHNYPHLTALFRHLGVETQPSDMSFAVSVRDGELEYAGDNLTKLFAQRWRVASPQHWQMLTQILRFNRRAKADLEEGALGDLTLGEYLDHHGYGDRMRQDYLLPMAAAIWSCPTDVMRDFPVASFLRFFENHGLLDLADRPAWRTVRGGSEQYIRRLLADFKGHVFRDEAVVAVSRTPSAAQILCRSGRYAEYEHVVFACHGDQALQLLSDADPIEVDALSPFQYQENVAILHSDPMLMPQRRRVWSSWNYLGDNTGGAVSVSYWMNRLQRLRVNRPFIVSLNPLRDPEPDKVHYACRYMHPVFTSDAIQAQRQLRQLQGRKRTWFCGSYLGYGFHEDGLRSAVDVARALGAHVPWVVGAHDPGKIGAIGLAGIRS